RIPHGPHASEDRARREALRHRAGGQLRSAAPDQRSSAPPRAPLRSAPEGIRRSATDASAALTMAPMLRKLESDVERFKQIVRGIIKKEFRKYLTQGELIGRQGKHLVSIPIPQIEIPRFRFGSKDQGGVGQGEGEAGDGVDGAAGTEPGQHILEVEVSLEELAAILGEELELPRIQPRGRKTIPIEKVKYSNVRKVGPESLRHFKRTFREA